MQKIYSVYVSQSIIRTLSCYFPLTAHLDYFTGVLCGVSPALKLWQHIIHTLVQLHPHHLQNPPSDLHIPLQWPPHYLMYLLNPYTPSWELQSSGSGFFSKTHTRLLLYKLIKYHLFTKAHNLF